MAWLKSSPAKELEDEDDNLSAFASVCNVQKNKKTQLAISYDRLPLPTLDSVY